MWTNGSGVFYEGDCRLGDRAATEAEVAAYLHSRAPSNADLRRAAYPPITDLADALVHQAMGDNGVALAAYCAACEAVKAKYPKPLG